MIGELSNRNVVVGQRNEPLVEIARRMRDAHVGDVVIVDNLESRRPVGILTDRDIVVGGVAEKVERLPGLIVDDLMTRAPVTAREEERIDDVIERMRDHGIRRVPVVNAAGSLTGILSVDDIVAHMSEELRNLTRLVGKEQRLERERLSS